MSQEWYYARNNQQHGPVSADTLKQMVDRGEILPDDLLWREGMANWTPAGQVFDFSTWTGAPFQRPASTISENPFAAPDSDIRPEAYQAAAPSRFYGYAGFWKRCFANLIDGILVGFASLVVLVPILLARDIQGMNEDLFSSLFNLFVFLMAWPYYAIMESSSRQATLGKSALGIIVTDMQGRRITFGQATGRYFGKIVSGLICYIGFIMAGLTERKQALHDMMAGTLVINRR